MEALKIISLITSTRKGKRFKAVFADGKEIHFGLKGGKTFIDEKDETKRLNYLKRHLGNKTERKLINNLTPSPALLSAFLLWGKFPDLDKNLKNLNNQFRLANKL